MNKECIWVPVVGFEGLYEINTEGVVRTVMHKVNCKNGQRMIKPRIKMQLLNVHGYYYVRLYKGNMAKNVLIHRALMEAFVPNPDNKPYIDHINTIRTDNRLENLKWVTSKENTNNPLTMKHIIDSCSTDICKEKQKATKADKCSSSYNPKRVFQYTLDGSFVAEYPSMSDAIRLLHIEHSQSVANIRVALDNNKRSAYGYMWRTSKNNTGQYIKPHGKYIPIQQIDEHGICLHEWKSITDAAKHIGVNVANLSSRIKHKHGLYKGMIFRYKM